MENDLEEELINASAEGDLVKVKSLISRGADVNYQDTYWGWTTLHVACLNGHTDIVDLLIRHNADINKTNNSGYTPLHQACSGGQTDIVTVLLSHNADINVRNKFGNTAMHIACSEGHTDTATLLLAHNADVNVRSADGESPLHYACRNGHTDVVTLLLAHNADINVRDKDSVKPLDYLNDKETAKEYKARAKLYKVFPEEIRGTKARRIFRQAIQKGSIKVHHMRLMVMGHYGVGKTTITKALLQERDQIGHTSSTDGIDVYVGKCGIDLKTRKWERRRKDLSKIKSVRQKIQQMMYNEKHREILEEKSLNPFSENWIFKKKTNQPGKQPNQKPDKKKVIDEKVSLKDLPSATKKSLTSEGPVEESSVPLKFKEDKKDKSSNIAFDDLKAFLPQEKELLPQKDETIAFAEFHKEMCEVEIWDFGGQSVFYTTHQAFLSPRCIYPLVIDGRKGLHDKIEDEILVPGELTSQEMEEFLRFWIFSIVTYAKGKVRGFPKIIPVITHMDQIPEDQRRRTIEYIFKEIERICNDYQVQDHIILDVRLSINALNPDDPAYDVLRSVILEVAETYPDWGELIPATWVPVEHSMMHIKESGYKILPVRCLVEINQKSEFPPLEDEELRSLLDFQHSLGNIVYFSDTNLRHNVIMHPKWLIDALKSLITADRFLQNDSTKEKMLQNLSNSGILEHTLLAQLWNNDEYRDFHNNAEYLLHTMVKMDLLSKPVGYDSDGTAIQSHAFIVPSMIRLETSRAVIEKLTPNESSVALLFTFEGKFLPKATFNRLVASCINLWPLESFEQKLVMSSGFSSFRIDVSHRLSIRMFQYQILTTVTAINQSQPISARVCGRIGHILFNQLIRICQVHKDVEEGSEDKNKKFYIEIPCCAKHLLCTQKFEDIPSYVTPICAHHGEQEKSINFTIWIRDNESYAYPNDEDCTISNPCPCVPDVSMKARELGRLSRRLQGNPENIVIVLDVDPILLANEEDYYKHRMIGKTEYYFRILMKTEKTRLNPDGLNKDLTVADEKNKHVLCKVIRRRMSVIESQLKDEYMHKIPSDELLDQLSSRITPDEAFHLFIELGLDSVEIDRTRRNFPRESLEQIKHMLRVWRGQEEQRPTFKILEQAIIEVGINLGELRQIAPDIMKMK